MTTIEGALRLWSEIVHGLQATGYSTVVPQYLKLSRVLSQARMTELLQGQPEAGHWSEIRRLAAEALKSLDPLVEAARILVELPTELQVHPAVAPPTPQPEPAPLLEPAVPLQTPAAEDAELLAEESSSVKTFRKRRISGVKKTARKSRTSVSGLPAKMKNKRAAVSRSTASAKRRVS